MNISRFFRSTVGCAAQTSTGPAGLAIESPSSGLRGLVCLDALPLRVFPGPGSWRGRPLGPRDPGRRRRLADGFHQQHQACRGASGPGRAAGDERPGRNVDPWTADQTIVHAAGIARAWEMTAVRASLLVRGAGMTGAILMVVPALTMKSAQARRRGILGAESGR